MSSSLYFTRGYSVLIFSWSWSISYLTLMPFWIDNSINNSFILTSNYPIFIISRSWCLLWNKLFICRINIPKSDSFFNCSKLGIVIITRRLINILKLRMFGVNMSKNYSFALTISSAVSSFTSSIIYLRLNIFKSSTIYPTISSNFISYFTLLFFFSVFDSNFFIFSYKFASDWIHMSKHSFLLEYLLTNAKFILLYCRYVSVDLLLRVARSSNYCLCLDMRL
jgi:hypothetical protein